MPEPILDRSRIMAVVGQGVAAGVSAPRGPRYRGRRNSPSCAAVVNGADGVLDHQTWAEPEIMSPSDWRLAHCYPGEPDRRFMRAVETVNAMFDREWLTVCRVARMLIERARYYGVSLRFAWPDWKRY